MTSKFDIPELESDLPLNTEALENLLDKANRRLLYHRDWLANLPRDSEIKPTVAQPPINLVTAPPSLLPRQSSSPPWEECNDISRRAFEAGANSATAVFQASISGISVTITSLNIALASAQASASVALSSATGSLLMAQVSMNSAVSVAERSASMMVASAAQMVASANAAREEALAIVTNEIQKAHASIASSNQAAQASILASQTAAMNTTKFALSLTFAILGSSIITVVLFYSVIRYRRRRKERRQAELKEKIHIINKTPPQFPEALLPKTQPETQIINNSPRQFPEVMPPITQSDMKRFEQPRRRFSQYESLKPSKPQASKQRGGNEINYDDHITGRALEPVVARESPIDPLITFDTENKSRPLEYLSEEDRRQSSCRVSVGKGPESVGKESIKERTSSLWRRHTEGFIKIGKEADMYQNKHMTFSPSSSRSSKPSRIRKPTLQYDPDRPKDPPIWLEENVDENSSESDVVSSTLNPYSNRGTETELKKDRISAIGAAI